MENHDLDFVVKLLQAGGTPVTGLLCYFLWQLSKQMTELKTSVDTFIKIMTDYRVLAK